MITTAAEEPRMPKRNRRSQWFEVDRAIRQAWADKSELRAIDPAAMASRRTWARPRPGREVTVRRTGSEGSGPLPRDPMDAIERARMRALVAELDERTAYLTVAAAHGWVPRVARALQMRKERAYDIADEGRERLRRRMVQVGLLPQDP